MLLAGSAARGERAQQVPGARGGLFLVLPAPDEVPRLGTGVEGATGETARDGECGHAGVVPGQFADISGSIDESEHATRRAGGIVVDGIQPPVRLLA